MVRARERGRLSAAVNDKTDWLVVSIERARLSGLTHDQLISEYIAFGGSPTTLLTDVAIIDVIAFMKGAPKRTYPSGTRSP